MVIRNTGLGEKKNKEVIIFRRIREHGQKGLGMWSGRIGDHFFVTGCPGFEINLFQF